MPGRNSKYQGRGACGRGRQNDTSDHIRNYNKDCHPEFSPQVSRKSPNYFTYATVKQTIIEQVQKNYSDGYDMATSLRNEKLVDLDHKEPRRQVSQETEAQAKIWE